MMQFRLGLISHLAKMVRQEDSYEILLQNERDQKEVSVAGVSNVGGGEDDLQDVAAGEFEIFPQLQPPVPTVLET